MEDKQLQDFIHTFRFLQNFNCFEAIDQMFNKMIKEDWTKESLATNKILIITFLRVNCMFKDKLFYYDPLLKKSIDYLKANNIEPENVLKGLI